MLALLIALALFAERCSEWALEDEMRITERFTPCGLGRGNACVVDGDTIKLGDRKIRILDIDAPELVEPKCEAERQLAQRAKEALIEELNHGPVWLVVDPGRRFDDYGRDLRKVEREEDDGRRTSIGDVLVKQGLAARYRGRKASWC